jgi:hypothetical protein
MRPARIAGNNLPEQTDCEGRQPEPLPNFFHLFSMNYRPYRRLIFSGHVSVDDALAHGRLPRATILAPPKPRLSACGVPI